VKGRGEAWKNQSCSNGRTNEPFSQRLLSLEVPEEEQVQCGKCLAKLKGTGEAPKGQPLNNGKKSDSSSQWVLLSEAPNEEMAQADKSTTELSERRHLTQVPQNFSPFLSGPVTFFHTTKRKARHTVLSAEAPEAPETSGAKNAQKKQITPHVRELPPTSLDALPGNETGESSPLGEDTQGPSPVDYNLKIEAEFLTAMVIEL